MKVSHHCLEALALLRQLREASSRGTGLGGAGGGPGDAPPPPAQAPKPCFAQGASSSVPARGCEPPEPPPATSCLVLSPPLSPSGELLRRGGATAAPAPRVQPDEKSLVKWSQHGVSRQHIPVLSVCPSLSSPGPCRPSCQLGGAGQAPSLSPWVPPASCSAPCVPTHPSVCPPIHPSTCPSVHPSTRTEHIALIVSPPHRLFTPPAAWGWVKYSPWHREGF